MKSKGKVFLVGAGPGDPGLLTVRGLQLLQRAEVVVYDRLVNPSLLRLAPPGAELVRRGNRREFTQERILELLVARAREGKTVVRLKGGDPYVFGRGAEEAEALALAKIDFEVVPGVSSVTAALNYAGIPLTHRDYSSSFTVFTGHSDSAGAKVALRYAQIAKIPGTKVVLMGTGNLEDWTRALVASGMPPETPVAVIQSGTLPGQRTVSGTLATIAKLAMERGIRPPAISIVGEVVALSEKLNWFGRRPLCGKRIVVTRAQEAAPPASISAPSFSDKLSELGADVLEIPAIKIAGPSRRQDIVDALLSLNSYDWLVFTSARGVTVFFDLFFKHFHDLRDLGGAKIAAVGPATAACLQTFHLQVDVMPGEFVGRKIAGAMAAHQSIENSKVCLLRAEVANPELPRALEEFGAIVDDVGLYQTLAETRAADGVVDHFLAHGADWLTFTSASTVEFFHRRFDLPKLRQKFPRMKIATIGPETSKSARALKIEPDVEALEHTTDGLLAALVAASGKR